MSKRYRLLPFNKQLIQSHQLAQSLLEDWGEFVKSPIANLSIYQWLSVLQHMVSAGAQVALLQDGVRDPDFLEEYEAFYSRQQKAVNNLCRRIHFFATPFPDILSEASDEDVLRFIDSVTSGAYLGFVTLRPLRHAPVGASILSDSPISVVTCRDEFPVHIAGCEFSILGTPYLQQDNAVGACAQASIWIALRTLRKRLGNSAYSPAELTIAATKHLAMDRVFPGRGGLTTHQMLEAIRSAGHDPLIVELQGKALISTASDAINFAMPYLESGLPVIIGLDGDGGGHAVVAIGYVPPGSGISSPAKLIIHNDNSGCYLELPDQVPITGRYALTQAKALITPLPEGISMTAAEAESLARIAINFSADFLLGLPPFVDLKDKGEEVYCELRIFLSTRHSFRRWAKHATDIDDATKNSYRALELPRFIWVVELHDAKNFERGSSRVPSRLGEIVLDASADALHGDGLLFTRLSGLLVGRKASDDGILIIEDKASNRSVLAIKAPASFGQMEPWR